MSVLFAVDINYVMERREVFDGFDKQFHSVYCSLSSKFFPSPSVFTGSIFCFSSDSYIYKVPKHPTLLNLSV